MSHKDKGNLLAFQFCPTATIISDLESSNNTLDVIQKKT
jgi:hypothetical protein